MVSFACNNHESVNRTDLTFKKRRRFSVVVGESLPALCVSPSVSGAHSSKSQRAFSTVALSESVVFRFHVVHFVILIRELVAVMAAGFHDLVNSTFGVKSYRGSTHL